jgi:hypothetical protein
MSTKVTIKWRDRMGNHPGFHLYEDVLDSLGEGGDDLDAPVYLRLDGVALDLHSLIDGGANVTVALPRELARELGLLPPSAGPAQSQANKGERRDDTL